jgi:hypothetical protein
MDTWHHVQTGGGCTALRLELPDGRYALLTDGDVIDQAPREDSEDLLVALYAPSDTIGGEGHLAETYVATREEAAAWARAGGAS